MESPCARIFVIMEELISYFKTATLPNKPAKINGFITVTDGPAFIESTTRRATNGDAQARKHLEQFREFIEAGTAPGPHKV